MMRMRRFKIVSAAQFGQSIAQSAHAFFQLLNVFICHSVGCVIRVIEPLFESPACAVGRRRSYCRVYASASAALSAS